MSIIEAKKTDKHYPDLYGEKLKTAPRGYPENFEHIQLLNYKHYTVSKIVSDNVVTSNKFPQTIQESFEALYPLNRFLNDIVEDL